MNVWEIDGVRQVFDEWITRKATSDAATVAVKNVGYLTMIRSQKCANTSSFIVYPSDEFGRASISISNSSTSAARS